MRPTFAGAVLSIAVAALSTPVAAAELISLDVRDLDIYDVVRLLSTQSPVNVVVDTSVPHHNVTLRLAGVTFEEALATLLQSNELEAVRVGKIVYVGTPDVMNKRYPAGTVGGVRTQVFPLANAAAEEVAKSLNEALPHGTLVVADRRTGSVLVGGSPTVLAKTKVIVDALDRSSALASTTVAMRFIKAGDALTALKATLPVVAPASAFASDQQNAVVLSGPTDFLTRAGALIAQVDRPGQQVRYDVKVTDVTPQSDASNVGIVFGGSDVNGQPRPGSSSTVTTFLRNSLSVNATLNALATKGRATILARPSLSTLNNVQASLLVGQSYPIVYFDPRTGTQQVQFVNVGVNLTVTPTIGSDGAITTDLSTDYSQFLSFVNNFPVIGTRKAQSTLRVRDGETIVIAGLFSDVDNSTVTKVPILGDIPVFGEIFKNRQSSHTKDEIVFLITPHLVTDGAAPAAQ